MTYIPKREKKAQNMALLCIITGFVLTALSAWLPYSVVFQLISLAAVAAGVFLLQRYVLCEYRYIIDDREDGFSDLIVYKKQGRNDIKVCHISLLNVEDIYRHGEKTVESDSRYAYNQNPDTECYVLLVSEGGKNLEIIIESDAVFLAALRERIGGGGGADSFAM